MSPMRTSEGADNATIKSIKLGAVLAMISFVMRMPLCSTPMMKAVSITPMVPTSSVNRLCRSSLVSASTKDNATPAWAPAA